MRYLDTNILVRIITGDIPAVAAEILETIDTGSANSFAIHDTVVVETCFVLEFHDYAMPRAAIADALLTLFDAPQILVADMTIAAVELYKATPKLDYTDCLLATLGGRDGVYTLDQTLQKTLSTQK